MIIFFSRSTAPERLQFATACPACFTFGRGSIRQLVPDSIDLSFLDKSWSNPNPDVFLAGLPAVIHLLAGSRPTGLSTRKGRRLVSICYCTCGAALLGVELVPAPAREKMRHGGQALNRASSDSMG